MDGSQRNVIDSIVYPYQKKPPPQVWKVWQDCILATFLTKRDVWRPTLNKPLQQVQTETEINWRESIKKGMNMEDAVLLLPGYIREAIGNLTCPSDNGL